MTPGQRWVLMVKGRMNQPTHPEHDKYMKLTMQLNERILEWRKSKEESDD